MPIDIGLMEQMLWPDGFRPDTWMIVDGARDRRIYSLLVNSYLKYECLYAGNLAYELEVAAPYLVQLELNDKYTRELLTRGWGASWGVVLRSDTTLTRLRRHFRTFLLVNDWRGKQLLFRYYDPRVLRVYLPTCQADELKTVFGPVKSFWTEADRDGAALQFDLQAGRLVRAEVTIGKASPVSS